jgi:hypothetical protein
LKFKAKITRTDYSWAFFKVSLVVFQNGTNYNLKQRIPIFHAGYQSTTRPNVLSIHNVLQSISFDQTLDLLPGESVSLEILIKADLTNAISGGSRFTVLVSEFDGKVYAEEDSFFEPSKAKAILAHELLDQLATITTNKKNVVKSNYFGRKELGYAKDGPGAYNSVSHGFWIRQFDKLPINEDNKFKALTTSFKDAIKSFSALHNIGIGIETTGLKETIRIEDKRYFYQPIVTIKLPNQVNNVKRSVALEYYYGSISAGNPKGGTYEEAQGLDESNGLSKFTTIINKTSDVYEIESEYRTDPYGQEFARRKPFDRFSSTDTSYDSDIFVNDCKLLPNGELAQRKYQDDLDSIPTGIFSPQTATNLRFSPVNLILKHGWWISSFLKKFPMDYLRYSSSSANSKLTTKLKVSAGGNGNQYSEDGNILNSELPRSRFYPEYVEFEHEMDFFLTTSLEGKTLYKGEKIPNLYGLIEYINEFGEIERGYFISLKVGDKATWKILKQ